MLKTLFYFIGFICIIHLNTFGQVNVDSLKRVLENTTPDSTNFRKYLNDAESMDASNAEAVITICNWVLEKNQSKPMPYFMALTNYILGSFYLSIDAYEETNTHYLLALKIAQLYHLDFIESAIYQGYGNLYSVNHQYLKSKEFYLKSSAISAKNNDFYQLAVSYYNLASLIHETSPTEFDSALYYLNLCDKNNQVYNDPTLNICVNNLRGFIYSKTLRPDSSLFFLQQANKTILETGFNFYLPYNLEFTGFYYLQKGQNSLALDYYLNGLKVAEEINSYEAKLNLYEDIANTYAKMGNYKEAYDYYQIFKTVYDSIKTSETTLKINNNITQFRLKNKEQELQDLTIRKNLSDQLVAKEKEVTTYVVIAALLLLIVALIMVVASISLSKANKEKKKANRALQEKNEEIIHKSELLVKLSKKITKYQTQMNPHFIFNALNSIQGLVVNNEKDKTLELLSMFSKLMRLTLNNSNNESISLDIELEYLNLYVNFEKERFSNDIQFKVKLGVDAEDTRIPPMMIQPFIENALKHAGLNNIDHALITLEIEAHENNLRVTITDNGKGINKTMDEIAQHSHAVAIIKSRIQLLFENDGREFDNSYFSFVSVPAIERGTRICFEIPLITNF